MSSREVNALAQLSLFGALTCDTIAFLADRCEEVAVPEGGTFFTQGDSGDCLFVLRRGRVAVVQAVGDRRVVLAELCAGACFGEVAFVAITPRTASVRALENCTALRLRHHSMYELSQRDLEQFTLLQMNLAREVARRLVNTNQALLDQSNGE